MQIAFIGTGIMGKAMIRNLMKSGYEVHVYARRQEAVLDLVSEGVSLHGTIADCVADCDMVITIVGFPQDVEEVYFSDGGILQHAKAGAYLVDMTTSSPALAQRIYEAGVKRALHVLDAPVTGGEAGAKSAQLSILVGGEKEDFIACEKVFQAMGSNINYQGKAGNGQHAKLANQMMIAGTMAGIAEAFTYMKAQGLDLDIVLQSLRTGAAGSRQLDSFGKKIIDEDFSPSFFMKHFIKDMRLAFDESVAKGFYPDILEKVLAHYTELSDAGDGELGTHALIRYYANRKRSSSEE